MDLRKVIQSALQQINNPVRNNASIVKAASSPNPLTVPDNSILNLLPITQGLRLLGIAGNGQPRDPENYQMAQNALNQTSNPEEEAKIKRLATGELVNMAGQMTGGVKSINKPLEELYRTASQYAKDVPIEQLKLNTPDFQRAMGDVLQGKRSYTPKMPAFIKNGVIDDGNTRIADQIRGGATSVKAIEDENIYRNLMEQVQKLLERNRDSVGRFAKR